MHVEYRIANLLAVHLPSINRKIAPYELSLLAGQTDFATFASRLVEYYDIIGPSDVTSKARQAVLEQLAPPIQTVILRDGVTW